MRKKLLFVVNVDWAFLSHRWPIAQEALRQGYDVHIATKITNKKEELERRGITVHPLSLVRGKASFFRDIKSFFEIFCLFNNLKPDIIHLVTIKPVLFGGIAARLARSPCVVAAVPGLGFIFLATGCFARIRRWLVSCLYYLALNGRNVRAIFQNVDDREILKRITRLPDERTFLIRGSGVDLDSFKFFPEPEGTPVVMLAARLLKDKGVCEFVEAASVLKSKGYNTRFCLVGSPDPINPASLNDQEIALWKERGIIEYWGQQDNMPKTLSQANIVVLPSYREGLPKVLAEAAACGRAIVTTDVPGCREAIIPDVTGLLVAVRNSSVLAAAIARLLDDTSLRRSMGEAGRKLAEEQFDDRKIAEKHLEIYRSCLLSS